MNIDTELVAINTKFRKLSERNEKLKDIVNRLLVLSEQTDQEYEESNGPIVLIDCKNEYKKLCEDE